MYTHQKAIVLLFILISSLSTCLESRDNKIYFQKIIPSTAFFELNRLNLEGDSSICYRVLLEFKYGETISDSEKEKLRNTLFFKNFCIADISVRDIFRMAVNKIILKIYVLNHSHIGISSIQDNKKTVIGIIDQGIDWKNKCFMKGNGKDTRIVSIWDQKAKRNEPAPNCIPYGIEYLEHDINVSLNSNCNLVPYEAGHGWIIAAVAAGSLNIWNEQNKELFQGKQIDIPIIMVNTKGTMEALLDAVSYIIQKSEKMKSKCVINFSFCKHIGPHDSNDMYLRAIDALLNENSLFVVAAGNEGLNNIYIREKVSHSTFLEFEISKKRYPDEGKEIKRKVQIEAWYNESSHIKISLISARGKVYGPVGHGEYFIINSRDGNIFISNGFSSSVRSDKDGANILINSYKKQTPQDGKWSLLIENIGKSKDNKIEAWITKSENCDTEFISEGDPMNSISFLAFSKKTVSVGSWIHGEGNKLIEANFSNNPCKNMECKEPLPNVLAPGRVYVGIPGFTNPMPQDGTSVSTALITRFIALTWDENPWLKASDIKENLNGKVVTFNTSSFKWDGSPAYRLQGTENTDIKQLILK